MNNTQEEVKEVPDIAYDEQDTLFILEKITSGQSAPKEENNISLLKYEEFFRIKHVKT